jgi:probable F420-dependent oxidoreductase
MVAHPFRFAVTAPVLGTSMTEWRDRLRQVEAMGFDTVVMADHFTAGWDTEPLVALTAVASWTSSLRVQTGVLGVDYRHPVLVHRMAATLDVVSEGRLTLGLGAGWLHTDYESAGLPYDPPGVRVSRLEEAVTIVKGLFGPDPFTYDGTHYRVNALVGVPPAVQKPHPPIFLGGGSPRVLRLAGRHGDVVGINASLRAGAMGREAVVDLSEERVAEKIGWVREGAAAAGRDPDELELEMNHWLMRVTETDAAADDLLARMAARFEVEPSFLARSPSVLVGTRARCEDILHERRERLGLSFFQLDAGFAPKDLDTLGPLVASLSGQ